MIPQRFFKSTLSHWLINSHSHNDHVFSTGFRKLSRTRLAGISWGDMKPMFAIEHSSESSGVMSDCSQYSHQFTYTQKDYELINLLIKCKIDLTAADYDNRSCKDLINESKYYENYENQKNQT